LAIEQSTYDLCQLFIIREETVIIKLQTDNTLLLTNDDFVNKEKRELCKTEFMTKECEKLISENPIRFNRSSIILKDYSLILT